MRRLTAAAFVASAGVFWWEARGHRARRARRAANSEVREATIERTLASAPPRKPGYVSVTIPAYDEANTLGCVLSALPSSIGGFEVEAVVIDDGSTDGTADVARAANAVVARHDRNLGQGDAIRTGLEIARRRGAAVVVTMDADGQHRPDQLHHLVTPVTAGEADYVQGSRFLGSYDDAGGARHAGIWLFTTLLNLMGGTSITDCTSGYRAIRVDGLARMRLDEDRFSAPEIILEARARGLRMLEIPVHIQTRSAGESKKPPGLGYPLGFLRAIVEVRVRQLRASEPQIAELVPSLSG